jgi:phosphatidylserine decarboxylase|tara:strand:- start:68976 stop:69629 length:654 start_codon:yes stop_codon:yes gene_type:complete
MFHKEGHKIIIVSFLLSAIFTILIENFITTYNIKITLQTSVLLFFILILQFFRNPTRKTIIDPNKIIAPVDGKVVIIKEVFEKEYFKKKKLQVSIFMSPINVHVTRYAISGKVVLSKYHPGKYLVAWHPKSSEKNERTTIVIKSKVFGEILYRQIAGALARRIINYAKIGQNVIQGDDAGFIKFGSRVDLFLPLKTNIKVNLNDHVKGGIDSIAEVI